MRWNVAHWVETVKSRWRPAPKSSNALDQAVGSKLRIAVYQRDDADGFRLEEIPTGQDRITADVVQRAAADVGDVADIFRDRH